MEAHFVSSSLIPNVWSPHTCTVSGADQKSSPPPPRNKTGKDFTGHVIRQGRGEEEELRGLWVRG